MGPRVYLNENQILLMAKTLGQYHAMSYVLRYHNETEFDTLRRQIIPLPFIEVSNSNETKPNLYDVLHRISFDRFFEYFDRLQQQNVFNKDNIDDAKLVENVQRLREKYFEKPATLLEQLRTNIELNEFDQRFGVFVHGDYTRNNVMFLYQNNQKEDNTTTDNVNCLKMFDFQQLRFASPALDLSFFMYFNTSEALRAEIWMDIIKTYHSEMYKMLEKTLRSLKAEGGIDGVDFLKILEHYSFEKFYAHFSRFAFYGAMISIQFLPWLLCSEEECRQLSYYFETDMHSDEFYKICLSAGGDGAKKCTLDIVRHVSKMGYTDYL